jgi:APA family basic amino acid/polyamine antiporter
MEGQTRVPEAGRLARKLGLSDAVFIGLGAMIGAGIFSAIAPATDAAGSWVLASLGGAAVVALCNALSSAQLAARYPQAGGTYVYGRERLAPFFGYLAGWGFVIGKTASCAAMALTFAVYVNEDAARALAVAAVLGVTALNVLGVERTARAAAVIVIIVLGALSLPLVSLIDLDGVSFRDAFPAGDAPDPRDLLQASGLLFFAFAGYARIATLGEEVVAPERTIPRAIPIALGITVLVYALVIGSALVALTPEGLARSSAPLAETVDAGWLSAFTPLLRAGAAVASLGVLLSLLAGVSRTVLAMARNRDLPAWFDAVHPRYSVPHRAEIALGLSTAVLAATLDLRDAIGFSSFAVLVYYALANAAALTLRPDERRWHPAIAVLGVVGCALLATSLPWQTITAGLVLFAVGTGVYGLRYLRRGVRS